jgi:hypothetical protein
MDHLILLFGAGLPGAAMIALGRLRGRGIPRKSSINPMPRRLWLNSNRCGLRAATLTQSRPGLCSATIVSALTNARSGFGIKGLAHGATDC